MYLRNVGNIGHIHTMQQPKNRVNINNYPPRKHKINKEKVFEGVDWIQLAQNSVY